MAALAIADASKKIQQEEAGKKAEAPAKPKLVTQETAPALEEKPDK